MLLARRLPEVLETRTMVKHLARPQDGGPRDLHAPGPSPPMAPPGMVAPKTQRKSRPPDPVGMGDAGADFKF